MKVNEIKAPFDNLHELLIGQDVKRKCRRLRFYARPEERTLLLLLPILLINKLPISISCSIEKRKETLIFLFNGSQNIPTLISTETHVPSPWYGQYRTHAHNHITRAVAAMESCFALIGAHQVGSKGSRRAGLLPLLDPTAMPW